jgi:lipopolysaccharide transport system permease protein
MANTIVENRLAPPEVKHLRITPSKGWIRVNFRELWEYRELLYFLAWRDVKIRYKQTALGATWAILQPFLQMVVFSLFFGRLANISSEGYPYPIFNYAGLLPWNYFSYALTTASNSLVSNAHMITKVYFPRLIVPISSVLSGLVDFAVAFVVLIGMMIFYRADIAPTWSAFFLLPLFLLLAMVTSLGVSLWASALNVTYRDVRYVIPFVVQFWMFATPVIYGADLLDKLGEPWNTLYGLNPMVGVVEGFRWALLGKTPSDPVMIGLSVIVAVALLFTGLYYFRRTEKNFADVI